MYSESSSADELLGGVKEGSITIHEFVFRLKLLPDDELVRVLEILRSDGGLETAIG